MPRKANPLRIDPQRMVAERRAFVGEMRRRFRELKGAINQLIITDDVFGIRADKEAAQMRDGLQLNTRWRFETDTAKIASYQAWLADQVEKGILEVDPANAGKPWTHTYIQSGYKKGLVRGYTDVNAAQIALSDDLSIVRGGKAEFLREAFGGPVAVDKIERLNTRAFTHLKGVTAQMDADMNRILADGIAQGHGPRKLARELNKNVDKLTRTRAETIARTELAYAHSEGQLDSFERLGIPGVDVMAEWSTAHDDLVCPLCAPMEGVVLSIKEARGLIPRHPNCRCAFVPANVGEHKGGTTEVTHAGPGQGLSPPGTKPTGKTTQQVFEKRRVKKRMAQSVQAEKPKLSPSAARAASTWAGADVDPVAKPRLRRDTRKAQKADAPEPAEPKAPEPNTGPTPTPADREAVARQKLGITEADVSTPRPGAGSVRVEKVNELAADAGVTLGEADFARIAELLDHLAALGSPLDLLDEVGVIRQVIAAKVAALALESDTP